MSKMLRKKLIPAEFLVVSSLLLAPSLALTGYGQNSPQSTPQSSPAHSSSQPALLLLRIPLLRHRLRQARRLTPRCRA